MHIVVLSGHACGWYVVYSARRETFLMTRRDSRTEKLVLMRNLVELLVALTTPLAPNPHVGCLDGCSTLKATGGSYQAKDTQRGIASRA